MSAIEMALASRFPYQRLEHEGLFDDSVEETEGLVLRSSRNPYKFRKVHTRKRFRLKVQSLRRFLRRKMRVASSVRLSCAKVFKRLKEGQAYFGDLFAGNYLLMQVNPTPLKYFEQSYYHGTAFDLRRGLPSSAYSIPRIAN